MKNDLPVLELNEIEHGPLLDCIRSYPRIIDVFRNMVSGHPLDHEVYVDGDKTLDTHIHCLYVPILLEHSIIVADSKHVNGFRPLYSELRTADKAMNGQDIGRLALNGMKDIVESSKPTDSKNELLTAYVQGEFDLEFCQQVMETIRGSAMGAYNKPVSTSENRKKMRIAVAVKVEDRELK